MSDRLKWMKEHIGKRVYRPKTSCKCKRCADVYENGLIITDLMHADYLCDTEAMYSSEGIPIQYFDTREEALEFEKNNPPTYEIQNLSV